MVWLKLTTVTFVGPKNKQKSVVRKSRINMSNIETYFEAADEIKNISQENKCNTLMLSAKDGGSNTAYHIVETPEEIDNMLGLDAPEPVTPLKPAADGGWSQTQPTGWK